MSSRGLLLFYQKFSFFFFFSSFTRADEGMYSVLVSVDSGALKRENTNRFRETLMVEALSKVQNISEKDFQRKVSTRKTSGLYSNKANSIQKIMK